MKKLGKKGFTLVEIVIVIVVIAILCGVLIPTFSGLIRRAKVSTALQSAKIDMECVQTYNRGRLSGMYYVVLPNYVFEFNADGGGIVNEEPDELTDTPKFAPAEEENGERDRYTDQADAILDIITNAPAKHACPRDTDKNDYTYEIFVRNAESEAALVPASYRNDQEANKSAPFVKYGPDIGFDDIVIHVIEKAKTNNTDTPNP